MKKKINTIKVTNNMEFLDTIKEKLDKKLMKIILIRFICFVYIFTITAIVTEYSSKILMPDLFENERITVNAYLFIPMFFAAMVLFFKEKSIIKFMFAYHFLLIFTVLTVLVSYDKRPIIVAPMIFALVYDKSVGLAVTISICAYNVFTLNERPDNIINGPEFMQIIVMLIISATSVMVVNKRWRSYFEIPLYVIVYLFCLFMQWIFGYYCQDYQGYEMYCEPSFKFKASMGVLISLVIFVILRNIYMIFEEKLVLKKHLQEISASDYVLLEEMKKNSISLYNHSIEVAELSGRAAIAIGASEDLAFAGGLYHDVGKMAGTNYVHEGIKIANRYKLPTEVKNIIIEHNVKNRLPKSKEAAIVMLADTAVSAIEYLRTNNKSIDEVKVFENSFITRLKNGALNDSGLTVEEFLTVKDVFMQHKVLNIK